MRWIESVARCPHPALSPSKWGEGEHMGVRSVFREGKNKQKLLPENGFRLESNA